MIVDNLFRGFQKSGTKSRGVLLFVPLRRFYSVLFVPLFCPPWEKCGTMWKTTWRHNVDNMRQKDIKTFKEPRNWFQGIDSASLCCLRRYFLTFKVPRNLFHGIESASLCSLAGRYDNPTPTRFLWYRDILYTNILYTWQSLYVTKFIQTLFIRNKIYTGQSLYGNKIYT